MAMDGAKVCHNGDKGRKEILIAKNILANRPPAGARSLVPVGFFFCVMRHSSVYAPKISFFHAHRGRTM
jgi:hypothetical protein